jgi:hypothetical protein
MKVLLKNILFVLFVLGISACTPSTPYEIKSPCVAIEPYESSGLTPCIRRPVNMDWSIA